MGESSNRDVSVQIDLNALELEEAKHNRRAPDPESSGLIVLGDIPTNDKGEEFGDIMPAFVAAAPVRAKRSFSSTALPVIGLVVGIAVIAAGGFFAYKTFINPPPKPEEPAVAAQVAEPEKSEAPAADDNANAQAAAQAQEEEKPAEQVAEKTEEKPAEQVAAATKETKHKSSTGKASGSAAAKDAPALAAAAPAPKKETAKPASQGSSADDLLKAASKTSASKTSAPPVDSTLPAQLTKPQVMAVMSSLNARVPRCNVDKATGQLKLRVVIQGSGKVSEVAAQGEHAGTMLGKCMEGAARGLKFPQFSGAPMSIVFPYKL